MRIAIVGAGIVGVATAYELAVDGHQVTVFDRRNSVSAEASFAHAGLIAPAFSAPWGSPWLRRQVLRRCLATPWRLPGQWSWLRRAWRNGQDAARQRALFELGRFSQQHLAALRERLALQYERSDRLLMLMRSDQDLAQARRQLAAWRDLGLQDLALPLTELDADQCRALEPDLCPSTPLAGGWLLPGDESGNCRQLAHLLREAAETRHNARFRFATLIERVDARTARPVLRVQPLASPGEFATTPVTYSLRARISSFEPGPAGDETFDALVLCTGIDSPALLGSLGVPVALLPVHGYSATFALRMKELGPRAAMVDLQHQVSITRLGPRLRVSGGVEPGGDPRRMHPRALETLYAVLQDWFPGAAQLSVPQLWKGTRPMLPEGVPLVGASGVPNVWLNLGHGNHGWALACGSARLIADLIGQRTPVVNPGAFALPAVTP